MGLGGGPRLERNSGEKAPAETYLTSPWTFHAWLRASGWKPKRPGFLLDPCACGWGGFSVGRQVGELLGLQYRLSDLNPRHPDVIEADAFSFSWKGAGAVITNPAFSLARDMVTKALEEVGEIVLLLPVSKTGDAGLWRNLLRHDRFRHRLGFGLLPEHAATDRLSQYRADSITGYGLPNSGVHHGIFVWEREQITPDFLGIWVERRAEDLLEVDRWRHIASGIEPMTFKAQGGCQMRLF